MTLEVQQFYLHKVVELDPVNNYPHSLKILSDLM
jgi:hypothetical protein